jgi:hypothetical protein
MRSNTTSAQRVLEVFVAKNQRVRLYDAEKRKAAREFVARKVVAA